MSASVGIRAATQSEAAAIAVLLGQLGYPTDGPTLAARLALLPAANAAAFVAIVEQQVVGTFSIHVLRLLTSGEPVAYLTSLVVADGLRGQGVGSAMIRAAEQESRARGADRLVVTTHLRRVEVHAFYERRGFEFTGRRYVKAL